MFRGHRGHAYDGWFFLPEPDCKIRCSGWLGRQSHFLHLWIFLMRDYQVWYNHSDYPVHNFKNNENNFRNRDKTKIFFGTREKNKERIILLPFLLYIINFQNSNLGGLYLFIFFGWPLKWSLRELQDNYLDLRLESTLSPVIDGGLEFLMRAASHKLKLKVGSEITHFTKSRKLNLFFFRDWILNENANFLCFLKI